jgi:putative membrane protein
MLWIKAFLIVFVASWFAGLFYLPRIFVNLAMVEPGSEAERARLLLMARKLLRFSTVLAVPALGLGLALWLYYGVGLGPGSGWMHAKLGFVAALLVYHWFCYRLMGQLQQGQCRWSGRQLRALNELPTLLLVSAVADALADRWRGEGWNGHQAGALLDAEPSAPQNPSATPSSL